MIEYMAKHATSITRQEMSSRCSPRVSPSPFPVFVELEETTQTLEGLVTSSLPSLFTIQGSPVSMSALMGAKELIPRRPKLFAFRCLLCLVAGLCSLFISQAKAECSGTSYLSSSTLAVEVNGSIFHFSPVAPDGSLIPDFLNITVTFEGFSEREREEPDEDYVNGSCDPTWEITDPLKRYFYRFVDELDCERNTSYYYLSPEARVDFITLNYTDSTLPGFWLAISLSTTTEEFTVYPSNDTTFVDPGQEYKWVYRPQSVKLSVEVANYAWIGPDAPRNSFLMFHWTTKGSMIDVDIETADWAYEATLNFTQNRGAETKGIYLAYDKTFMADGVPFVQADPTHLGITHQIYGWTIIESPAFLTHVPFCTPKHWDHLVYDPTILAIFGSGLDSSNTDLPSSKSKSRMAGIVAGTVVGVVVIGVVIIALLSVFVPSVRQIFRPFAKRNEARTNTNTAHSTDASPLKSSETTQKESSSPNDKWTRSSTPTMDR